MHVRIGHVAVQESTATIGCHSLGGSVARVYRQ